MEIVLDLWEALFLMIISILILVLGCRKLRQQFPVRVECWFCGHHTTVPHGNRNCWDCPHCDQYNGFTLDGDYNKAVPAQYTEDINHPVRCQPAEFLSRGSFLCPPCQCNQLLKFKQLAAFEPLNEAMYDEEMSFYKRHLEKVYTLCPSCDSFVKTELERLDESLNQQQNVTRGVPFTPDNCDEAESMRVGHRAVTAIQWLTSVVTLTTSLCSALLAGVGADGYRNWLAGQATHGAGQATHGAGQAAHGAGQATHSAGQAAHGLGSSPGRSDSMGMVAWLTEEMMITDGVDRLAVGLCGLLLCLFSKLLHGKHRVHLGDALHILLWVGVVGIGMWLPPPPSHLSPLPPLLHLVVPGVTLALELFLLCRHRHLSNATAPIIKRLSLEAGGSGASSETASDAVSSVSTSCRHRFKSPFLDSGLKSPILDSGDGPGVPTLNTVSGKQQTPADSAPHQGVLGNGTCGTAKKDSDMDTLGKGLGAVLIGHPSSESGYSTGRSSVFSSKAFGALTQLSVNSGVPFPRPLICPAKLSVVSFSQAGSGMNPLTARWGRGPSLLSGADRGPGQHANPILPEAPPHSMFSSRTPTPGSTFPTGPAFMSKYDTSPGPSTLFSSLNDLRTAHLQASPLTTPYRTRSQTKACSEVDFRLRSVGKPGRASSEVNFPLHSVQKTGRASSEVNFPLHSVQKTGRASSEVNFPLHSVQKTGRASSEVNFPPSGVHRRSQATSEVGFPPRAVNRASRAASSEVGFPPCGVTANRAGSLTSWWRDSSADLRQDQPAVSSSSHAAVFSQNRHDDWRESAVDSTGHSVTSSPVECDSTTPRLPQLKISKSSKKRRRKKKTESKPQWVKEVAADRFFVFSDDDDDEEKEEEEEEELFNPTNQSTVSTVILQSKKDWGWLQWVAVGVMIFSVCTNLFLTWIVWASRS